MWKSRWLRFEEWYYGEPSLYRVYVSGIKVDEVTGKDLVICNIKPTLRTVIDGHWVASNTIALTAGFGCRSIIRSFWLSDLPVEVYISQFNNQLGRDVFKVVDRASLYCI
jgi:hypothetical protein